MIEKRSITIPDAVDLISSFAQTKIKIDLNPEVLQGKLNLVCEQLDTQLIQAALSDLEELEVHMKDIDHRIKVITNRCSNELIPRQKALTLSESSMILEIEKLEGNLESLKATLLEIEAEMEGMKVEFEQTLPLE